MDFRGNIPTGYVNQNNQAYPYCYNAGPVHNSHVAYPNPYLMQQAMPTHTNMGWNNQTVMQWVRPVIGERKEVLECEDGCYREFTVPVYGNPQLMPVCQQFPVYQYPTPPARVPFDSPSAQTTAQEEGSEDADLDLPQDFVGAIVDSELLSEVAVEKSPFTVKLPALLQESEEVEAYFEASSEEMQVAKRRDPYHGKKPDEILDAFVAVAKNGVEVRPQRYNHFIRNFERNPDSDQAWNDAMLHDLPSSLLKSLDKIPYTLRE